MNDGGNIMKQIVVSSALQAELAGLTGPVELVDAEGVPVGQFAPRFIKLADDQCPYSEEELKRMRAARGGRPLAEIWQSLDAK
jgi:hypothetical protein